MRPFYDRVRVHNAPWRQITAGQAPPTGHREELPAPSLRVPLATRRGVAWHNQNVRRQLLRFHGRIEHSFQQRFHSRDRVHENCERSQPAHPASLPPRGQKESVHGETSQMHRLSSGNMPPANVGAARRIAVS